MEGGCNVYALSAVNVPIIRIVYFCNVQITFSSKNVLPIEC